MVEKSAVLDNIDVSVVFSAADGQLFKQCLCVPRQTTIREVILTSDFLIQQPDFSLETLNIGIYNLRKNLDDVVQHLDRIEIYRPLLIDPKDRRRRVVDEKRDPAKWRRAL